MSKRAIPRPDYGLLRICYRGIRGLPWSEIDKLLISVVAIEENVFLIMMVDDAAFLETSENKRN